MDQCQILYHHCAGGYCLCGLVHYCNQIVFLWAWIRVRSDLTQLQGWIVGVSNTYGLIFIVVFLGYGLGELPVTYELDCESDFQLVFGRSEMKSTRRTRSIKSIHTSPTRPFSRATAIQTEFYPIEEKIKLCNENILHIEKQLQMNKIKSIPITTALNSVWNEFFKDISRFTIQFHQWINSRRVVAVFQPQMTTKTGFCWLIRYYIIRMKQREMKRSFRFFLKYVVVWGE